MKTFMIRSSIVVLAAFASAASCLSWTVHERRDTSSGSAGNLGEPLQPHETIRFSFYLTQPNIEDGSAHLLDISDPSSSNYGKHWSRAKVREVFQPDQAAVDSVKSWLDDSIDSSDDIQESLYQGKLTFITTAQQAANMFQTNFSRYYDAHTDSYAVGCEQYSLPSHLSQHIDFVTPTIGHVQPVKQTETRRSAPKPRSEAAEHYKRTVTSGSSVPMNLSTCYEAAFPECISALYNIPPFTGIPNPSNVMGIFNTRSRYTNETYSQADLDAFFTTFDPRIPNGTHPIHAPVDGGVVEVQDPQYEGSEAMLDYSVSMPIIYPQEVKAFVTDTDFTPADTHPKNTGVEAFLDAIDEDICLSNNAQWNASLDCDTYTPTHVLSFSYAAFEAAIPKKYAIRVCNEFMKLGLQGVTVVTAAGDDNVGLEYSCGGENLNVFTPEWFATCPWVLTVGGTQIPLETNATTVLENSLRPVEIGWYDSVNFGGGGGFSNYFEMPDYQKKAVEHYLNTTDLGFPSYAQFANSSGFNNLGAGTDGLFNREGRAYPDVSGLAQDIALYWLGEKTILSGTSAATPLWGGIITRINEERLAVGKSTVGFINPVLYQIPFAMNDIVNYTNYGCDFQGFPATQGWDAFTGLGSPRFDKLLEVFMALP